MKKEKFNKSKIHYREKPKVIVLSGYGLNCEEETKFAFEHAGGVADIVHINDLIENPKQLLKYNILAFPGGFSYGDDMGSGKAFASKIKNHLKKEFEEFLAGDTLAIGICNGFQIMTSLGILPGALAHNEGGRYIDRWVDLEVPPSSLIRRGPGRGSSPWTKGIKKISLSIAHGEGRYITTEKEYKNLLKENRIAFKYVEGEMCKYQNLKANPNGAMHATAGVLGYNGRVLGMMPHPERAMFFTQRPDWELQKEVLKRKGKKISDEGAGILLFKNAVRYFTKA